ncbi:hypothetical protein Chor_014133 [Crotalus horridus]
MGFGTQGKACGKGTEKEQNYYLDGRVAKVTDFLKTRLLDTLSDQIRKIQKVSECCKGGELQILQGAESGFDKCSVPKGFSKDFYFATSRPCNFQQTQGYSYVLTTTFAFPFFFWQQVVNAHMPGKRIWLEGIGAASEGGITNLSDSYAASFLWLNSLGMLANQGIDVVMRHSFFDHGHNHLVDQNFNPLPDYWLSLLYKQLVGPRVLAVHVAGLQRKPRPGRVIRDKLRIYAHCTSYYNHNYVRGSITIYIINLHRSRKKIKLVGTLRDKLVHQYVLQPDGQEGLQSRSVQLNGQLLTMLDDGTLPNLKPRPLRPGRTLVIPPLTMSFYVVKNVNALACRYR